MSNDAAHRNNVVNLSKEREKRQDMEATEQHLLAMFEKEVRENPSGTFNMFSLDDGSTRITATVPPDIDPETFVSNSFRAIKDLKEKF